MFCQNAGVAKMESVFQLEVMGTNVSVEKASSSALLLVLASLFIPSVSRYLLKAGSLIE